jgi:hypothetical protein
MSWSLSGKCEAGDLAKTLDAAHEMPRQKTAKGKSQVLAAKQALKDIVGSGCIGDRDDAVISYWEPFWRSWARASTP